MPNAPLLVRLLDGNRYAVTSGDHTYTVDASSNPPVCGCDAYRYRPAARPCKHGHAVLAYRAEPVAKLLDALTDKQTLDVIDPSHGTSYAPYVVIPIDPEDKAVALAAVAQWQRLREVKPQPDGYYGLWRAACEAYAGMDAERDRLPSAAKHYAIAREWVRQIRQQGRVA